MGDQILRVAKLKTGGNVKASLEHMLRENGRAPNADATRSMFNKNSVHRVKDAWQRYEGLEPDFKAKNNVQALEYLITASPDFFRNESKLEWMNYLEDGLDWIKERHGEKNIVASSIQVDETTPHLSVIVRPLVNRKMKGGCYKSALSARTFVNGKKMLSAMQDDFHDEVAKIYSLGRGNKGSILEHKDLQTWYGEQAGGAERIRELERLLEEQRQEYENSLRSLEDEVKRLKSEGGRWRKKAADLSEGWFVEDIERAGSISVLNSLKAEISDSQVLPRGAQQKLSSLVNKKVSDLTPSPTRGARGRGRG